MATTAEFIGVYIADIITTATITIIVATIITITAIGRDLSGSSRQQASSPQGKGRSTRSGLFPFATQARSRRHASRGAAPPRTMSPRLVASSRAWRRTWKWLSG